MVFDGIPLDPPKGIVSLSHSHALDMIRGHSSNVNDDWLDVLGQVPWGLVKDTHPERFQHASNIFSLASMDYQISNGGIMQYFDNCYHVARDPFHDNDVERVDLDAQKAFFTEVVKFAMDIYAPDRLNEIGPLDVACKAFQELWYEEDAEGIETIYRDEDEFIWDDDLEEEVPNPDYFEPYDETTYENVIHNDNGFDDTFYKANDFLEELLELQAQLCCKKLVLEVQKDKQTELLDVLEKVLPESAFMKPSLSDRLQAAEAKASASEQQSQQGKGTAKFDRKSGKERFL